MESNLATHTRTTKSYKAGRYAYSAGLQCTEGPYTAGPEYQAWMYGWTEAKQADETNDSVSR